MARLDHAACAPVANVLLMRLDVEQYSTRLRLSRLIPLELETDVAEAGIDIDSKRHSTGILAQPDRRSGLCVFDASFESRRQANRSHVPLPDSNRFTTVNGQLQHR